MTQLLSPGLGEPLIALARRNTDGIFHTNRLIGRNPGLVLAWRRNCNCRIGAVEAARC
jgi:hypothetical protein